MSDLLEALMHGQNENLLQSEIERIYTCYNELLTGSSSSQKSNSPTENYENSNSETKHANFPEAFNHPPSSELPETAAPTASIAASRGVVRVRLDHLDEIIKLEQF